VLGLRAAHDRGRSMCGVHSREATGEGQHPRVLPTARVRLGPRQAPGPAIAGRHRNSLPAMWRAHAGGPSVGPGPRRGQGTGPLLASNTHRTQRVQPCSRRSIACSIVTVRSGASRHRPYPRVPMLTQNRRSRDPRAPRAHPVVPSGLILANAV
jgi:hypothetical protein